MPKDTHSTLPAGADRVLPEQVSVALAELAGAAREGLLALAVETGLQVLQVMLAADVDRLVGPRGCHNPTVSRCATAPSPARSPSAAAVCASTGRGSAAPTVPRSCPADLAGVRRHRAGGPAHPGADARQAVDAPLPGRAGLEPIGSSITQEATGTSKSAVSRRFLAASEHGLAELLAQDLSELDLVALLVDGIRIAEHACVVVLGITIDGTKVPLGLAEGATENATVVRDLLASLRDRGLEVTRPILVVVDGVKALRRAVEDVFDHPVIQRCQLH
jgi:hypothetical protein